MGRGLPDGRQFGQAVLYAFIGEILRVDHFRLANQLRSAASCDEEFSNGMVDVVLYTDEQPSEMQPARFCSKRRISSGNCSESPAKIVRHLREQLECTNIFRKIQILEGPDVPDGLGGRERLISEQAALRHAAVGRQSGFLPAPAAPTVAAAAETTVLADDQLSVVNPMMLLASVEPSTSGFQNFRLQFPQQCESEHSPSVGMSRLSASISQPCLSSISLTNADGPTQIFPWMYLGSQQDALDTDKMKRGITHVVNLSTGCPRSSSITSDENFLRIPVNDSYQEKLSPHFERAWEFLEGVRTSGNVVLIHCLAGISRSPTLAISYVMRYKNMSSEEAYKLVKEKRPSISPNFNFMGQLLEYEQLLIRKGLLSAEASSKRVDRKMPFKTDFDTEVSIYPIIRNS
ncbi:unnamed protein product [Nippostrongylus brasiliensis]|uniref:protein-tyrosine-phosphatase n=1 Tax=Nippostrongylus brasiliensis TaxID=27835 RepID=A0A158R0Q5_NIPBR|nr:unnamed protein product [Nippostrongylus brasiliensis]